MEMENKKVPELRKIAKEKGIKPIPSRKADLIRAIRNPSTVHSKATLQEICEKHKDKLDIVCAGKGITRKYLLEKLTQAGLIMQVEEAELSSYERKFREADNELHTILAELAPHVMKLDQILAVKVGKKKVSRVEDPWRFLYSEYASLTTGLEKNKNWKRLYKYLIDRKKVPKTLHSDFVEFSKQLPLITYAFLLQSEPLQQLADTLDLKKMFAISDVLKGTNAFLARSADAETQAAAEVEGILSELPSEILNEILQRVPNESVANMLIASRAMQEAEQHYRGMEARYGNYILSRAQKMARQWIRSKDASILGIEAPPSWGKTALLVALAIDAVNEGKKVVMHTTPAMIPFFLDEMEEMMGKKFPDLKGPLVAEGKYSLLVPSFSKHHRAEYAKGSQADILLVTVPGDVFERLFLRIGGNHPVTPIENYSPDLVLVDEAHKNNLSYLYADYVYRNADARLIGVSANSFAVNMNDERTASLRLQDLYKGSAYLRFSLASISEKVPDFGVEIRDIPPIIVTNPTYRQGWPRDAILAIERAELLRTLDKELVGNTVVFSWRPLTMTGTQAQTKVNLAGESVPYEGKMQDVFELYSKKVLRQPKSIVIYKGPKSVKKFQDQSRKSPSTFFLTYKVGAEGLNLDTIDNVVLLDAEHMDSGTIFQAVARAQRVSNPKHTVRVLAYSQPKFSSYLRVALKFSEGFRMSSRAFLEWVFETRENFKTIQNYVDALREDLATGKRRALGRYKHLATEMNLFAYVMAQKDRISASELALIFESASSKKAPADMIKFFSSENLLPELSPLSLLIFVNHSNSIISLENDTTLEAQKEEYVAFLQQIRDVPLETKIAQFERERLRYIVI